MDVADLHGGARGDHAERLSVGDVPPQDQHDAAIAGTDAENALIASNRSRRQTHDTDPTILLIGQQA